MPTGGALCPTIRLTIRMAVFWCSSTTKSSTHSGRRSPRCRPAGPWCSAGPTAPIATVRCATSTRPGPTCVPDHCGNAWNDAAADATVTRVSGVAKHDSSTHWTGAAVLRRTVTRNLRWLTSGTGLIALHQLCEVSVPVLIGIIVDRAVATGSVPRDRRLDRGARRAVPGADAGVPLRRPAADVRHRPRIASAARRAEPQDPRPPGHPHRLQSRRAAVDLVERRRRHGVSARLHSPRRRRGRRAPSSAAPCC